MSQACRGIADRLKAMQTFIREGSQEYTGIEKLMENVLAGFVVYKFFDAYPSEEKVIQFLKEEEECYRNQSQNWEMLLQDYRVRKHYIFLFTLL